MILTHKITSVDSKGKFYFEGLYDCERSANRACKNFEDCFPSVTFTVSKNTRTK